MPLGTLYVVATPIGNLEDLSPRAVRVLKEAALIAAEDTRVTRKLLSHCDIHTPLTSYHAHTRAGKADAILARLLEGEDVALVSDAGTPGISDPGEALVRAAIDAGVTVLPVPGPSAVMAALCASGLDPAHFLFQGFLPRSRGEQRRTLAPLRALPHTLLFYEAPGRLVATLGRLREELGDRPAAVARELTKKFEEFIRGSLSEIEAHFATREPRGECVILVSGATSKGEPEVSPEAVQAQLRDLLTQGCSVRDAARAASEQFGIPRREAYALAQGLAEELRPGDHEESAGD
jgi:16S rRNA (cytidine1402-2'-O)-methyltransferase